MPVETPAFVGPQFPNLADRLMGIGKRSNESGYKAIQFNLPANPRRVYLRIQNNNDTVLFLAFGGRQASATDYDVALKACSVASDGSGGFVEMWNMVDVITAFSTPLYKAAILEYYI